MKNRTILPGHNFFSFTSRVTLNPCRNACPIPYIIINYIALSLHFGFLKKLDSQIFLHAYAAQFRRGFFFDAVGKALPERSGRVQELPPRIFCFYYDLSAKR